MTENFLIYLLVMAVVTYLIRALPLVLIKKEIKNPFILSFLHYIPYAVLTVMTIPAIFYSTSYLISACVGLAVALVLSYFGKGLTMVAMLSCLSVLICEIIIKLC